jgi:glycosyltransferase involved in cell wall biosynthesis
MVKYSLIVPSINRTHELVKLFESLESQTLQDFEVILVDQNPDGRLLSIVEVFSKRFFIKHLHSETKGAAHARNIGISQARGEILLWPDDDCWYLSTFLHDIDRLLSTYANAAGIIGILVDEKGNPFNRWKPSKVAPAMDMDTFIHAGEPAIILRKEIVMRVGGFDESIGIGAETIWGAGESTDLCLRVKKAGAYLVIAPSIRIFHPNQMIPTGDLSQRQKAHMYARGMGGILKKNHLNIFFVIKYFFTYARAIFWNSLQFKWNDTAYHWTRLKGVVEGWIRYPG